MYMWLHNNLVEQGLARLTPWLTLLLLGIIVTVISLAARWVLSFLLVRLFGQAKRIKGQHWAVAALQNKVPQRLGNLVVPFVIATAAADVPESLQVLQKAETIAVGVVIALLFSSVAHTVNSVYSRHNISKSRPITGVLQVAQIVVYLITGIVVVAVLLGQSPGVLIGGLGAAAAVVSFVFKDPILGFIAGVQLTTGDLLHIGDWITVPGASADGDIIELTMTTVKVRNFDNSVTSVPAYSLVTNPFINWRSMADSGSRRIKRALYINAAGVRLVDDAMFERFADIDLIKDYMAQKKQELAAYNDKIADAAEPLNESRLTNLGTFRAYMQAYLEAYPGLRQDMAVMVRQLDTGATGIPLEVYAFTATADWAEYEGIQADIFEHFFSAVPRFELSVYQSPSGTDLRAPTPQ